MYYKESSEVLGSLFKVPKYMIMMRRNEWGLVVKTVSGIYLPFSSFAIEPLKWGGAMAMQKKDWISQPPLQLSKAT